MAAGTYERKTIDGGVPATTLNGGIDSSQTTAVIASATGWPDGSSGPFVIAIDRGGASEEKILVSSRTGTTLTIETRGYDNTTGVAHDSGADVEHVLDASTVDQANRYVNLQTGKGTLVIHNGTNPVEFDPGLAGDGSDDNYVLLASDAAATGWTFGRLETVVSDASAPAVAGYRRIWLDTTSDLLRVSDGSSWIIPSTVPSVADATARNTLTGATPTAGTVVYREDINCLEMYVESKWRPVGVPTFASASARNTYFALADVGLYDGAKARTSDTYSEWEYRQDEWIRTNQKITTSESAPANPHDGDIWFQPVS